jgi:hypothetical protein
MALPTSTIVMALVTAVPFGLAIKDTVTGTSAYDFPSDDDREDEDTLESMDRAAREYEEGQQKKKAELQAAIEKMIPMGRKGTLEIPGHVLSQAVLEVSSEEQERLEDIAHAVFTPTRKPDGTLASLTISFPQYRSDENICLLVGERLDEAWGVSSRTYASDTSRKHFVSMSPQQRVTFVDPDDSARCELILEPFVYIFDFIGKAEPSIVPMWAIGKPAAKLVEKLGGDAFSDETQVRWTALGVGEGVGGTELYARVQRGRIVTVTAQVQTSEVTMSALVNQLTVDYGEPVDEGDDVMSWPKAKLSVKTLDESAGSYLFTAGQPLPTDEES